MTALFTEKKRPPETQRKRILALIVARHRNCTKNWWCMGKRERDDEMAHAHADRRYLLSLLGKKP